MPSSSEIHSSRLVIISDPHLTNLSSRQAQRLPLFIEWASENGFDICINGDVFDVETEKPLKDVFAPLIASCHTARTNGSQIFCVLGNQDVAIEGVLQKLLGATTTSALNLHHYSKKIRIEHGHLYDPLLSTSPRLYQAMAKFARAWLRTFPTLYKYWMRVERFYSLVWDSMGIIGEHPNYLNAAQQLIDQGFDFVIFGHTHHVGEVSLKNGVYLNTGAWLLGTSYVEVAQGRCELRFWAPHQQKLAR